MYIDSHAHIFFEDYKSDIDDVLARARNAGIEAVIVPGTTLETSREAVELAQRHDDVFATVGIHPHDASKATPDVLHQIEELSNSPKVVAIGEIGVDYHYDFSPRDVQREVFRKQIDIAIRRNLPVVVHTRESLEDALSAVQSAVTEHPEWRKTGDGVHTRYPALRGVFHCFPGGPEDVWKLLDLGFLVSYPGIVTFKNSPAIETLKKTGFDHILLETDSPFMSPVPLRGKRNEPANVVLIAKKIAEVFGVSEEDVARTATFNTKRLFGIGPADPPRIAYKLRNSLYLNITLRCNADCIFCDRKGDAIVKGHNLKIEKEPTSEEVISAIGDPRAYDEVVFCGYGEPTIRLDVVKQVAAWTKEHGGRVRLNTDGHGNIINHRNIVPELAGLIDSVSISLNSVDPAQYGRIMRLDGERYHTAMIEFAQECKKHLPEVVMTIVGIDEVDTASAREFVENRVGVTFRVRPYF
ncbi:MAG TPA: TatD family hydrolase [Bacteroidota bacterium]|nr:TatD family hydrolase [Bacteroidota bacterium]